MSEERLELSANGLRGHCSAVELLARADGYSITPPFLRQSKPLLLASL